MKTVSLVAVAVLLAVAGCGSAKNDAGSAVSTQTTTAALQVGTPSGTSSGTTGASTAQAASLPDACSLLTKAEVEAAVGGTVLAPKPVVEIQGLSVACEFNSPQFPIIQVVRVSIITGTEAEMKAYFELAVSDQKIPGLGQDARWSDVVGTLSVLKGRFVLDVQVTDASGSVTRAGRQKVAQELAPKAIARVP